MDTRSRVYPLESTAFSRRTPAYRLSRNRDVRGSLTQVFARAIVISINNSGATVGLNQCLVELNIPPNMPFEPSKTRTTAAAIHNGCAYP
jgi:hypothetical protein